MTKKLLFALGFGLLLSIPASAQDRKIKADPFIWTELQADYFLPNQSFFFFRNQYRHDTNSDFPGVQESGALSKFSQVYFQLGYDHKLTDHWRAALSARYTLDAFNNYQVYQVYLQHNGKIGAADFLKRVSYDIMNFKEDEGRGRIRPFAALERNVTVGTFTIRPQLSYELFFYNNFGEETGGDTRLVDRTRLRAGAGFQVSKHFWITPYFLKQTDYFKVESTFTPMMDPDGNPVLDDDGNPVLVENKGGNLNIVYPVLGIDLRFLLPGKHVSKETIPNLGNLNGSTEL